MICCDVILSKLVTFLLGGNIPNVNLTVTILTSNCVKKKDLFLNFCFILATSADTKSKKNNKPKIDKMNQPVVFRKTIKSSGYTKDKPRYCIETIHCVKIVKIWCFFWPVFPRIGTEYGEIRSISSYSVQMRENTDQKKLRIWTLHAVNFRILFN